jgi:hypothetical protein
MARSRRNLNDSRNDSRAASPSSDGSSDEQGDKEVLRGRSGKQSGADVDTEMDVRAS